MFAIVIVSVAIGFCLILLLKRTTASIPREADYFAEVDPRRENFAGWELPQLEGACRRLLIEWGLQIETCSRLSSKELEILAHDPKPIVGGHFIIHALLAPRGEVIETSRVVALSDIVRSEQASKGVFITTGFFSADTARMSEGAPLELINARRLEELLATHDLLDLA